MRKTLFNPVVYACAIHLHGLPALNCPNGFTPRFIQTSGEISEFMKMHVINLAERRLRQVGKRLYEAKIAVIGLAYKKSDPPGVASNQDHRGTGQSRDRGAGV